MRGTLLIAVALLVARSAATQTPAERPLALEARFDGIFARRVTTTHAGLGVTRAASRNLELQIVLAGGVTMRGDNDDRNASGRADVLARFAPRPTRRDAWAAYGGGGASVLVEKTARGRAVLAIVVGVRGRRQFVEMGLGGGFRAGAGVRF
ncbi:MAG TPA: hypothetical protein VFB46_07030 [Gemmatimonadaceae bacterium]|nr:hypothetical protein [Gemmatimonadaceae bacterium]